MTLRDDITFVLFVPPLIWAIVHYREQRSCTADALAMLIAPYWQDASTQAHAVQHRMSR